MYAMGVKLPGYCQRRAMALVPLPVDWSVAGVLHFVGCTMNMKLLGKKQGMRATSGALCIRSRRVLALEDGVDQKVSPSFEQAYFQGLSIPFRVMSRASGLLAAVFGKRGKDDGGYHVRLMAALQSRAFTEKNDFVMFVTWVRQRESEEAIAGIVTLSKGLSASGASGYESETFAGPHVYSICNMAVREDLRRQGIARTLLSEVERYVRSLMRENESAVLVLSVEKYSLEARHLYAVCGYSVEDAWEDPRWLDSIDRGRVDVPRRILMYKSIRNQ